jgi:hypothetical protein
MAEPLADLGRAQQALAVAQRAVTAAGQLTGSFGYQTRAAESPRRAAGLIEPR